MKVSSIDVYLLFYSYLHSNKTHQSNQTRPTTLQSFTACEFSSYFVNKLYDLQYMYIYNLCRLRTIYAYNSNSTTK
jgi:hypothetical protein